MSTGGAIFSMANINLTINYVEKLKPSDKKYNVHDKLINELILRVSPSGTKTYYLDVKLPNSRTMKKIGDAMVLTPQMARERAKEMLLQIQAGETFKPKLTLKTLIEKYYTSYCTENYKTGQVTIDTIKKHFDWLFNRPVESITFIEIQEWRSQRIRTVTAATANRNVDMLKGALSYAFKNKLIGTNPLRGFSKLPEKDSEQKVRYLTDDEYAALMAVLDEREDELRAKHARTRAHAKGQHLPDLGDTVYADYFKPLILTALGTGIRRNAIFHLLWSDIDFDNDTITLRATWAKNKKTAVIPMSKKVKAVLEAWRKESPGEIVFPSPKDGGYLDNADQSFDVVLKKAGIKNFRWHDMRHDFASRLAMAGVDLNTIRELMTHNDISTTMRYAHLSPNVKKRAVDLI